MNIQRNKKTFYHLLNLFLEIGESKLGRPLTDEELQQLVPSIAKKCENIRKSDIVTKIYRLELAKREKNSHTRTKFREKLNLKKEIASETKVSPKLRYTSSQKALDTAVASNFSRIHIHDRMLTLKKPTNYSEKLQKLKLSYSKDFKYRAPIGTAKKVLSVILAAGVAFSLQYFASTYTGTTISPDGPEPPTSGDTFSPIIEKTALDYINDYVKYDTPLNNLKKVFMKEYNDISDSQLLYTSSDLLIRSVPHASLLEVTSPSGVKSYVTRGSWPQHTLDVLEQNGYTVQGYPGCDVYSVTNSDKTKIFASCIKADGECVPVFDGSHITTESGLEELKDNNTGTSEILCKLIDCGCFNSAAKDDKDDYIDDLLKYFEKNPDSAFSNYINEQMKLDSLGALEFTE